MVDPLPPLSHPRPSYHRFDRCPAGWEKHLALNAEHFRNWRIHTLDDFDTLKQAHSNPESVVGLHQSGCSG